MRVTAARWAVPLGKSGSPILGRVCQMQLRCQWIREAKWRRAEGWPISPHVTQELDVRAWVRVQVLLWKTQLLTWAACCLHRQLFFG